MADEVTQVLLPDGTVVDARITDSRLLNRGPGEYSDVGFAEAFTARVEGLTELVKGVAATMREATAAAAPDEVSVAFGVELAAKPGRVVSVLADGEAKGSIAVTLTWRDRGRRPGEAPGGDGH